MSDHSLFVCLFVCLSICLLVCLFACLLGCVYVLLLNLAESAICVLAIFGGGVVSDLVAVDHCKWRSQRDTSLRSSLSISFQRITLKFAYINIYTQHRMRHDVAVTQLTDQLTAQLVSHCNCVHAVESTNTHTHSSSL